MLYKVRDHLNATTWANHCDWPIKRTCFHLLALLEIIVSCTYLSLNIQFHGDLFSFKIFFYSQSGYHTWEDVKKVAIISSKI